MQNELADSERRSKAETQINRIRRAVSALDSQCEVIFDASPVPGTLRFRVENALHVPLIETSGNILIESLETTTNAELRDRLISLSNHRL
jgi:hypothetical protein